MNKKKTIKQHVVDYVRFTGSKGATYTDIIKFLIIIQFGREYNYHTDRGYQSARFADSYGANFLNSGVNGDIDCLYKEYIADKPRYFSKENIPGPDYFKLQCSITNDNYITFDELDFEGDVGVGIYINQTEYAHKIYINKTEIPYLIEFLQKQIKE